MRDEPIDEIIRISIMSDRAGEDITSGLVVDRDLKCSAVIMARSEGVISGQRYSRRVFDYIDDDIIYLETVADGQRVKPPDKVAEIKGRASSIMGAERTALNFLGRLSGIATLTSWYVKKLEGTGITLLDTRKTTPGMRSAEKKAVRDGGGANHRMNLADYILVKENHIKAAGGLDEVIRRLGRNLKKAEIEVDSIEMLRTLLRNPPERIMLDNFTPRMVDEAVREIEKLGDDRPEVEVSGGITLESISDYLIPGVDYISVGSLTASAPALDLTLVLDG